ncbi:hypothetical protein [Spiroplasma endosymbiont of Dactylopius coccus]|nr:hypothetical protein [Spiroplasma ixodetis]
MPIKNEILQNLESKSEENVEQKPTKWKEFKTKHRTPGWVTLYWTLIT